MSGRWLVTAEYHPAGLSEQRQRKLEIAIRKLARECDLVEIGSEHGSANFITFSKVAAQQFILRAQQVDRDVHVSMKTWNWLERKGG